MKKRTPFSQNGSDWMLECSRCIPASFAAAKAASISVVARATWSIAPAFFRRTMVFIGFDHQIAKLKKRNALPGGFVHRFQRRNKPQLLVKCNGLVEIICWDANVRHTGQNLRKAHTFVSSAIFTTALTMLALSEMLLSMAFWMSSKSKMLVTIPFRLILPEATASIAMG